MVKKESVPKDSYNERFSPNMKIEMNKKNVWINIV